MRNSNMQPTPHPWPLHRSLLAVALAAVSGIASACTSSDGSNSHLFTLNADASQAPGTVVISTSGRAARITGCNVTQRQPLELSLQHSALRPVSTVDYRAAGTPPTSWAPPRRCSSSR